MNVKFICNYREFKSNADYPSVKSSIGFKTEHKDKLLTYMKQFDEEVAITKASEDYINGERQSNSVLCYTDRIYWWTNEQIYHFEKYDMKLNDDFISHVLAKTAQQ
ncbi:MAG: hypothetical protein KBA55_15570 [Ruminococcus sp.]|nr:hypothetical protein [Ruminococcus sp.]